MASDKKEISSKDILDLVEAKTKDSHITYEDIFRKIDSVRPNYNKEMWKRLWIPVSFYFVSIIGMLFITKNTAWHRLSVITFCFSTFGGCYLLDKYEKRWWWVLLLDLLILYVVFSEALLIEDFIKVIKEVFL